MQGPITRCDHNVSRGASEAIFSVTYARMTCKHAETTHPRCISGTCRSSRVLGMCGGRDRLASEKSARHRSGIDDGQLENSFFNLWSFSWKHLLKFLLPGRSGYCFIFRLRQRLSNGISWDY